jgi:hypothetical protein
VNFEVQVVDHRTTAQLKQKPDKGVYIHGIYIEGARWDSKMHVLM